MRQRSLVLAAALLLLLTTLTPMMAQDSTLTLTPLGTYATGAFDAAAAEIVAFDPATQTLYVINGNDKVVDMLDASDVTNLTLKGQLSLDDYGDAATSVSVYDGTIAVAVAADPKTDPGQVVFFTTEGEFLSAVQVGALPDMLTFTPDGQRVVVALEGEPAEDYSVDPEGAIGVIDVSAGAANVTQDNVRLAGFAAFDAADYPDVRVYGPNATLASTIEPEYVAISPDSSTAYATLQENNALAVVDLETATVTAIVPLGYKDHSIEGNGLDVNNDDGTINIATYPLLGLYLPDAIAGYEVDGAFYLVTANEGDARDWEAYAEEVSVEEVTLDAEAFPNAAELQSTDMLGNLTITSSMGDAGGDGDYDTLHSLGGRSFSIWDTNGALVWDSGDQFEQITAELLPENFNSDNAENGSFDDRSDNKGPEPEGVAVAPLNDRFYAFIALERVGGIMVYDVTDPTAPTFVTYATNRDFSGDAEAGTAGDLAPEGLIVIPAELSPNGNPLLAVANEVSGTTTVFEIGLE